MSGGYFHYQQNNISDIEEKLERYIIGDGKSESEAVMNEMKKTLETLREAYIRVKRLDWYLSCDDSEESYLMRLRKELKELNTETDHSEVSYIISGKD